jgi:hypothetical protein
MHAIKRAAAVAPEAHHQARPSPEHFDLTSVPAKTVRQSV